MTTVILVIHILAAVILTTVVLMQRSEGGALGIGGGGGGGGGGLMSGQGVKGALVRTTIIFGAVFFVTSLTLTTMASRNSDNRTDIERNLDELSGDVEISDQPATLDDLLESGELLPGTEPVDPLAEPATQPADPLATDPLAEETPE